MRIEVITVWYNEAFLAPFFLRHYSFADRITLFYDMDTTDDTLRIANQFANVRAVPFRFSSGFSSEEKQRLINWRYRQSDCDWVLGVDADEFVFYKTKEDVFCNDIRPFIRHYSGYDIFKAPLHSVFPHKSEGPLDPALPAVPQRRHGNPTLLQGFIKPVLLKAGLDVLWWVGCHALVGDALPAYKESPQLLYGAHWHKADLTMALERILRNRVPRIGKRDKEKKLSVHYTRESEQSLREEFARFATAPQLF